MVLSYVSVLKLKTRPKMESLERLTTALVSEFSDKDASVPLTQVGGAGEARRGWIHASRLGG